MTKLSQWEHTIELMHIESTEIVLKWQDYNDRDTDQA